MERAVLRLLEIYGDCDCSDILLPSCDHRRVRDVEFVFGAALGQLLKVNSIKPALNLTVKAG